jgi:hypothetical protein
MANVLVVLAIAVGVIILVEMVVFPIIEAQAKCTPGSIAYIASKGRCFKDSVNTSS